MKISMPFAAVLGILLFSVPSYAVQRVGVTRKPIQIDHLNVDYNNKIGKGQVQFLTYHFDDMSLEHKALNAALEMKDSTLSITDGTTKFSISKILDFLNLFDSIRADDLNFYLENSHFTGTLPQSFIGLTGHHFLLTNLLAECGSLDRDVDYNDDTLLLIFEMCMGKAKVKLDEMTFPESATIAKVTENILNEAMGAKASEKIKVDRIKNFTLNIEKNDFNAHARVKLLLDLGVHTSGRVEFEADQSRYKVHLRSANVGFIGIRWLIFRAIRELKDPSLTVEEPYIYIDYKKSLSKKLAKQ